jgi:hypothetical protein
MGDEYTTSGTSPTSVLGSMRAGVDARNARCVGVAARAARRQAFATRREIVGVDRRRVGGFRTVRDYESGKLKGGK